MYKLINTRTYQVLSKHYTIGDAAKAANEELHKRRSPRDKILTLHCIGPDGQDVDDEEWLSHLGEQL